MSEKFSLSKFLLDGLVEASADILREGGKIPNKVTYMLDCPRWPGVAKYIEESGELSLLLGKLMSNKGSTNYWGDRNLLPEIHDEIADVMAVISFMVERSPVLNEQVIVERASKKLALFKEWTDK